MAREAWGWVRMRILDLLPDVLIRDDKSKVWAACIAFGGSLADGNFEIVWIEKLKGKGTLKVEHIIEHSKLRY